MEETRYADTFIYVPSVREIVMIAEGNRTNLLDEDEAEGYVDYIYYDQHELSCIDAGCADAIIQYALFGEEVFG